MYAAAILSPDVHLAPHHSSGDWLMIIAGMVIAFGIIAGVAVVLSRNEHR